MVNSRQRKNTTHNCENTELSLRKKDEQLDALAGNSSESLERYDGEVTSENTEIAYGLSKKLRDSIELLDKTTEIMSSELDSELYKEALEIYSDSSEPLSVKNVEREIKNLGYSFGESRQVSEDLIDNELLEVAEPGRYQISSLGESVSAFLEEF